MFEPEGGALVAFTPPFALALAAKTASVETGLPVDVFAVSPMCAIVVPTVRTGDAHPLLRLPERVTCLQHLPDGRTETRSGMCLRVCRQLEEAGSWDSARRHWDPGLPAFASDQVRLAAQAEADLAAARPFTEAVAAADFARRLAQAQGDPGLTAGLMRVCAVFFTRDAGLFAAAAQEPSDMGWLAAMNRLEAIRERVGNPCHSVFDGRCTSTCP